MKISPELLARAHGALGVEASNGPCAGVLRELVEAVEGTTPPPGSRVFVVSPEAYPALVYVSGDSTLALTALTVEEMRLRALNVLNLRVLLVVLDHVRAMVDAAIRARDDE